jgi:hypothetical protein
MCYLWVETERFGRLPDTQQVKDDLLHGKIESFLKRERRRRGLILYIIEYC